jgi:hypothetical protein
MAHSPHGMHHFMGHLPVEPIAAIVLSAAGVLTSWAGYQSAMWDGVQMANYGRSQSHRVEATQAALDAGMTRAVEVGLFRAWAEAKVKRDGHLAAYYEERFPRDLHRAFNEWMAQRPMENPDAAESPFALSSYRPHGMVVATDLDAKADKEFQDAIQAKHTADAYVRAGVVLASAMFFAGIGQVFKRPMARLLLAATSLLALVLGTVLVVTLPVLALSQLH